MELLFDIAVIFGLAVVAVVLGHRARIPPIAGMLLAGVLAGPNALRLVKASEEVEILAEIGVVLLLFVLGMEFSLRGVVSVKRSFLIGGTLQVALTIAAIGLGSLFLGFDGRESTLLGMVVALSSTAIVLTLLRERAELDSPHGRIVVGTLIYQDIAVVPFMLAIPLLAGGASDAAGAAGVIDLLARIAGVALAAYIAYRWVVPWLLFQIARTRSREAFLLGVLVICIAIALLTSSAGLSLALGAFLAGLIISESAYSHQAVSVIMPFRDTFLSLFFVSVGMLLDLSFLAENVGRIALLTAGLLLIKPIVAGGAALAAGLPVRSAVLAGVALGQIGEFSLVLSSAGVTEGLLTEDMFQIVLAVAVVSMILTPMMMNLAPRLSDIVASRLPLPNRLRTGIGSARMVSAHPYSSHLVIVGFGTTGQAVARAADESCVPYAAIEIGPENVREGREAGLHVHYGDGTQQAVLEHVNIAKAKAVVVVIDDPGAARRITELARRLAPEAFIVIRSRYLRETEPLHALGADEVIADELEVSVEIFARVLARFLVPREDIERVASEMRLEWREMARSISPHATSPHHLDIQLPEMSTRIFRLSEHSPLVGSSIADSRLRADHEVTILAIRRGEAVITNAVGADLLEAGDVLFVIAPDVWSPDTVA